MKEHEWIEYLERKLSAPDGVVGIGDDAAVLPGGLLVTTDTYVEGLHFRSDWASWIEIGAKIAQSAVSDIAAMGGVPLWLFANLSSSAGANVAKGLLEGILSCGVPLLGGDTTGGIELKSIVTLTVIGRAERPVLRAGARIGDIVYVSGPLGGSAAGLSSLINGSGWTACEQKFLAPRARLDLGPTWGEKANAMTDVSDGLSTELAHIAEASGVRIFLDIDAVPCPEEIRRLPNRRELILSSGDEYELVATSSEPVPSGVVIGRVEAGRGVHTCEGEILPLGYDHDLG